MAARVRQPAAIRQAGPVHRDMAGLISVWEISLRDRVSVSGGDQWECMARLWCAGAHSPTTQPRAVTGAPGLSCNRAPESQGRRFEPHKTTKTYYALSILTYIQPY